MGTISPYGLGRCRGCSRPVRWATTQAERQMPLDPEPDQNGNVVARLGDSQTWYARIPTTESPQAPTERRFMPHVATCPSPPLPRAPQRPPAPATARPRTTTTTPPDGQLPLPLLLPDPPAVASLEYYRARKDKRS